MKSNEVSILEELKRHFETQGIEVKKQEIRNAISCVYVLLDDKQFVINLIINNLYPKKEIGR
jgi:hypothetical protein